MKQLKLEQRTSTIFLCTQPLPFVVAKPILAHEKGFYAMFSRIDGASLPVEAFERFTPGALESFGKSIGPFLSFLHNHKFPTEILEAIPSADDPFEVALREARRQLTFIREHTVEVDINQWAEKLESLHESLDQMKLIRS